MFKNRTDAGQQLADVLDDHDIEADIVLAIPRGGLPVGRVVADSLGVPLDIVSARKLGAPWNLRNLPSALSPATEPSG